ncbi:32763_t:CDS:10, partial [Gigaspora margarita]
DFKQGDYKLYEHINLVHDKIEVVQQEEMFLKRYINQKIVVACKLIDGQNENEMVILHKLGLSQILKFYGYSVVNNSQVMILGWAELGNLWKLYEKSLRIPDFNNVSESDADEIIAEDDNILPLENNVSTERHDKNIIIHNDEVKITYFGHARNDNIETHVHNKRFGTDMNTPSSGSMDNASLCFRIINGTREEPVPGIPEEKNPIHARKLFKEAADEYNQYVSQLRYAAESQFRYALLLLATEYSENSSDNAMYYLGYIYVFGKFEAKMDEMRGIKYLRRAARNDNYRAVALLANLENGEVPLILFDKDPFRARQLFKEIVDKYNHSEAQCRYAFLLLDDIKKVTNEPEKGNLYKKILHYLDLLRVRRDKERGIKYFEKAASNNNDRAIVLLAKLGK